MLDHFPGFEISDLATVQNVMSNEFGVKRFEFRTDTQTPRVKANWVNTKNLKIIFGFCNLGTSASYEELPIVRQTFEFGKPGRIQYEVGGRTTELSDANSSFIVPQGTSFRAKCRPSHGVVSLRIENGALKSMMRAMLGDDVPRDIAFDRQLGTINPYHQHMKQAVFQYSADLDLMGPDTSDDVRLEYTQSLIIKFLLYNTNTHSRRLKAKPLAPSVAQLKRVEEYIQANWNRRLDVEALSQTFGISVRSIFRYFRKFKDVSPLEYAKQVRLHRAKLMIESDSGDGSVMAIALKCGFGSHGHFSREYQAAFGELPSETHRRMRYIRPT